MKKEIKKFLKSIILQQRNLRVNMKTDRTKTELLYETLNKKECPLNTFFVCINFKLYPEMEHVSCGNCMNVNVKIRDWECALGHMDYQRWKKITEKFKQLNAL